MAHDYSSTHVGLTGDAADSLRAVGRKIPESDLAADGRETDPHVTLKYGLHDEDPDKVRELLRNEPPIKLKLGKVSLFPPNKEDGHEVVKADVHSEDLRRLHKKLTAHLKHTDTHPDYHPHATIAYVKIGKGKKYDGNLSLIGKEVTAHHVVFSSKNGTKTEVPLRKPGRKYYGE